MQSLTCNNLTSFSPSYSAVVIIAPGDYHTCAVLASGGVYCWGDNFYGQLGTGDTTARLIPTASLGLGSGAMAA